MNNSFGFDEQPCLQYFRQNSDQSNSLLADLKQINNGQPDDSRKEEFNDEQEIVKFVPKKNFAINQRIGNKKKKKSFYRDKMAHLVNEQNFMKHQYKYADYFDGNKDKTPINKEEQLKRNRDSAKQSRQRKKEYIITLELKIEQNKKAITELTNRLRQAELQRNRLCEAHSAGVKNFLSSKSQSYERLQQTINSSESESNHIGLQLEQMFHRFGAAGTQRQQILSYYMNEIWQNLLGDIHKYLINCELTDTGILDQQIFNLISLEPEHKQQLCIQFKGRLRIEIELLQTILQEFHRIYQSIVGHVKVIENIFDEVRVQFSHKKIASLLLWFQQNKYTRQMKKMRGNWIDLIQKEQQIKDCLRKQTKIHSQ